MSPISTHPTFRQHLRGARGVPGPHSLVNWIILAAGRLGPMKGSPWTCGALGIYRGGATNP